MDISKFHIPTLDSPNWGQWYERIQSSARITMIWEVMRGNILTTKPIMRDLSVKPTTPLQMAMAAEQAVYVTATTTWNEKNSQGLSLLQATISNVIWQKHESLPTAKGVLDALEVKFGKVRGGGTDLPPAGQHGENTIHRFNGSVATDPIISG